MNLWKVVNENSCKVITGIRNLYQIQCNENIDCNVNL